MVRRLALPVKWIAPFVWLFAFSVWGQEGQSAAKPDSPTAAKPDPQTAPKPELITSVNLDSFRHILQAMGFECTWDKDKDGKLEDYFIFRAEGYKIITSVPTPDYIALVNIFTTKISPDAIT